MRVMVLVKATADSEAGVQPTPETLAMFEQMGRFNEELVEAGVMQMGEGLHPSSNARRVMFDGPARSVEAGPFTPAEELVAGFWIWKVKDLDEAVAWAERCPNPMPGRGVLELRPIMETEALGEVMPPELREQEARLRAKLDAGS